MGIVEFLRARLDEDERVARAAGHGNARVIRNDNAGWVQVDLPQNCRPVYDVRHIARHDPARVLREVDAKRAIMNQHPHDEGEFCGDGYHGLAGCQWAAPCPTVRALAAVYADHRDYNQEWA